MLGDGTLLLSDETNKHYYDTEPWQQKVAIWRSEDNGATWDEGTVASDSATDGGGYARTHGLSATMNPCHVCCHLEHSARCLGCKVFACSFACSFWLPKY